MPALGNLRIGDTDGDWHDRFLIRSDRHMPHSVFLTCGNSLRSQWEIERQGKTLEDTVPDGLRDRFAEGCQQALKENRPVQFEGGYQDREYGEVLFRCVVMPVQAKEDRPEFICGAYSHKVAA